MISKDYLKLKPSRLGGQGVFTSVKIKKNIPIIEMTGDFFNSGNLPDSSTTLQVGPDIFIGPSGGKDDYVNHSCDPNCYLSIAGNRAILYSLYDIAPDSELTFDYSTSSTDTVDIWQMRCNCGSVKCRKLISGFHYLSPTVQEEMKNKGMLPLFMRESIFR
jgi:hypothetical protein